MGKNESHIKTDHNQTSIEELGQTNPYGFDLTEENVIGFVTGNLQFKVMGFRATHQLDVLTATVKITLHPHLFDDYTFIQKINLYDYERVNTYCRTSATQLSQNVEDIKKGVNTLREQLEKYRLDELKNNKVHEVDESVSKKTTSEAKAILTSDNTMECLEGLLKQAGLVTETKTGLRLMLILLSRHFDKPLHVLLQGSQHLCKILSDTLASTIPVTQIHQQTSMSASSLYYTKNKEYWKHKVLHLDFIDRNFKGAVTLKEFIDNSVLKRQTTESDYVTRQLFSTNKTVAGPICLMAYSDNDLLNDRYFDECFLFRVEETQTNRAELNEHLKKESAGLIDPMVKVDALKLLKELQRQIKPMNVVIPYATELELPEGVFQPTRSLSQLLTFIKTVALLHQHQLKIKTDTNGTEYIVANAEHLEIALELFKEILITKSDVLSQSQRSFLESLKNALKDENKTFKLPEVLQMVSSSKSSAYRHFDELKELGYIVRVGGNKKKGVEYRVVVWKDYLFAKQRLTILDTQLEKIKQGSFPQVSRKFPKKVISPENQSHQ